MSLHDLLDQCVQACGSDAVQNTLRALLARPAPDDPNQVLTIIANAGVHEIPARYLHGDVYEASRGNWAVDTDTDLAREVRAILLGVANKLRENPWQVIYLIPTGHPAVSMQIKTLVYRVLRINTIDLVYIKGRYYQLEIDQREVALEAGQLQEAPNGQGDV